MGAKVRVQLGLSTAAYRLTHLVTPAPGGPLDLSTLVHGSGLTWWLRRGSVWPEVMTMTEQTARLVTIRDAAKALSVSRGQVCRLVDAGVIRIVRLGPQTVRIPAEDLERLTREGVPRAAIHLLRRRGGGGHERR